MHRGVAIGVLEYVKGTTAFGVSFERGGAGGKFLPVRISRVTDRRSMSGAVTMRLLLF